MMKKLILITFCFIFHVNLYSQIEIKLFYNENWELCKEENANFYRISYWDTLNNYFDRAFTDYAINNMRLSTGEYIKGKKEGIYKYHFPDGNIKCQGKFKNNQLDSVWTWFHDNNIVKQKIMFINDEFKLIEYNDSTGINKMDSVSFSWSMKFINAPNELPIFVEGIYSNNKKDGKWKIYNDDQIIGFDLYKKGIYKKSKLTNNENSDKKLIVNNLFVPFSTFATEYMYFEKRVSQDEYPYFNFLNKWEEIKSVGIIGDSILFKIDLNPRYLGGMGKIQNIIAVSIRFPSDALNSRKGGLVYVEITIDENGKIIKRVALKSPSDSLKIAAFKAIDNLDSFKPAIYNGKPIKSKIIIPIRFSF